MKNRKAISNAAPFANRRCPTGRCVSHITAAPFVVDRPDCLALRHARRECEP